MKNQHDREWSVIHRLIEADKAAALATADLDAVRPRPAKIVSGPHLRWWPAAAAVLLLAVGMVVLLHLLPEGKAGGGETASPLTAADLPFFQTMPTEKMSSVAARELGPFGRHIAAMMEQRQPTVSTVVPAVVDVERGDPIATRNNIAKAIREKSLERFIARFLHTHKEEKT